MGSRSETTGVDRNRTEALVRSGIPLVHYAVAEIAHRLPSHVSRDDLISAGLLGLVQAANTYDETRGVRFDRYAAVRIRGALLDELRCRDWATRSVRSKANELRNRSEALVARLRRDPSPQEIADELGIPLTELHALQDEVHRATVLHMDSVFAEGGAEDFVGVHIESPEDEALLRERIAYLFDAVHALPDRLRRVIVGYYFEERPMEELAGELGVTESRISQLRAEAIARLRDGINSQLDPDALPTHEKDGVVARRRSAYYSTIASASDARARLSLDIERARAQLISSTPSAGAETRAS
jgi:RNA polymerase sigma factor for flagellar operon FliA